MMLYLYWTGIPRNQFVQLGGLHLLTLACVINIFPTISIGLRLGDFVCLLLLEMGTWLQYLIRQLMTSWPLSPLRNLGLEQLMLALRTTGGGPMELPGDSPIGHRITRTTTTANSTSERSTGCRSACGMMMMGHIHSFVSINHRKGTNFHFQQYTFLLYDCSSMFKVVLYCYLTLSLLIFIFNVK